MKSTIRSESLGFGLFKFTTATIGVLTDWFVKRYVWGDPSAAVGIGKVGNTNCISVDDPSRTQDD